MTQPTTSHTILSAFGRVKRISSLFIERLRLKSAEKTTIILAAVAFYAVAMALGLICLVFISLGIGHLLATTAAPHIAYLIIAAFYMVLLIMVFALRKRIFIDPIARFISRVLVEMPEEERAKEAARRKAILNDIGFGPECDDDPSNDHPNNNSTNNTQDKSL